MVLTTRVLTTAPSNERPVYVQTEDETQKELVVDRAFLPLDHDAQRADLRQYRRHQHEQTDVQDEGKEQIVLHAVCPFMLRIYML